MRQDSTVRLLYEEEENQVVADRREGRQAGRNPYLADYARQRGGQKAGIKRAEGGAGRMQEGARGQRAGSRKNAMDNLSLDWYPAARAPMRQTRSRQDGVNSSRRPIRQGNPPAVSVNPSAGGTRPRRAGSLSAYPMGSVRSAGRPGHGAHRPMSQARPARRVSESGRIHTQRPAGNSGRGREAAALAAPVQVRRRSAISRRRQRVLMQRVAVGLWALCIVVLAVIFVVRNDQVSAAGSPKDTSLPGSGRQEEQAPGESFVQGLPADVYAKHPDWTENFLTRNEYSRPGDALESVTNIFVHYTANPGTSAAQNRSYFEQQKDTHEASVSAHFIIGYEGEIIQCVPLDEIAYAVMTRNYDSISIECCFLAQDGSFTQETYDSLILLLAWLTDAYGLDANDILRHYDCGGKKCPLYYTEHPGAWEQLKKDVQAQKEV